MIRNRSSKSTQPACSSHRQGLARQDSEDRFRPEDACAQDGPRPRRSSAEPAPSSRDRPPRNASEPKTWKCVSIRPPLMWINSDEKSTWATAIVCRVRVLAGRDRSPAPPASCTSRRRRKAPAIRADGRCCARPTRFAAKATEPRRRPPAHCSGISTANMRSVRPIDLLLRWVERKLVGACGKVQSVAGSGHGSCSAAGSGRRGA